LGDGKGIESQLGCHQYCLILDVNAALNGVKAPSKLTSTIEAVGYLQRLAQ